MSKILLISPSLRTPRAVFAPDNWFPPLGISYLSSVLKKADYDVDILDSLIVSLKYPEIDPIDFECAVKKAIIEKEYDFVGISVLSHTRIVALNISRTIREMSPKTKVIWGGAHASVMYRQIIKNYGEMVDAIIVGNGEDRIIDAISYFINDRGINAGNIIEARQNIIFLPNGHPKTKLDDIPFPDYTSYQDYSYSLQNVSIIGSRGCSFNNCDYCASRWIPYSERSPDNIVNEIGSLVSLYKIDRIHLHDNTFTSDRNRTLRLFKKLEEKAFPIQISMKTRFDCIDEEIIGNICTIGGKTISFGLETGNQELRKKLGKDISNSRIKYLTGIIRDHGLSFGVFILLGHPDETDSNIDQTVEFLEEIKPNEVVTSIVCLYPGTQLYQRAIYEGRIKHNDWLLNNTYFTYVDEERKRQLFIYEKKINTLFPRFIEWTENAGLYSIRENQ